MGTRRQASPGALSRIARRSARALALAALLGEAGCGRTRSERALLERSGDAIDRAASEILDRVRGARIIGLGEFSHGEALTRRIHLATLKRAVLELGCRGVVLEGRFSDALALDEWVHRRGERAHLPAASLLGTHGTLSTVEWADTLTWIRDANDRRAVDVRLSGTDPCLTTAICVHELADRLDPYSAPEAARVRAWAELGDADALARLSAWRPPAGLPEELSARLSRLREVTLEGSLESWRSPGWSARERVMADNVDWLAARTRGCVVVLAHTGHVDAQAASRPDRPHWIVEAPMGQHLRDRHGDDYAIVHFTAGAGRFRAHRAALLSAALRRPRRPSVFRLPRAGKGSLERALEGHDRITVLAADDLGDAADRPIFMRDIPAIWGLMGRLADGGRVQRTPARALDVLVFLPTAIPVEPTARR